MANKKNKRTKKGMPSGIDGDVVTSWQLSDDQSVPAIEQCRVSVVKYPVLYYQHFDYSPEAMDLRSESVKELGWSTNSFNLPIPPCVVGQYSLLTDALKKVKATLDFPKLDIRKNYPSTITCEKNGYGAKWDYCDLFFNHAAYEFYHLLFILGHDMSCPFENVPDPPLNTLNQLMRWARSFEFKRRKMYKQEDFSWEPYREGD